MMTPLGKAATSKVEQVPNWQNWVLVQPMPQPPQFFGSFNRLTQLPLQNVLPPPQIGVQVLAAQYSPTAQALEQLPQLDGSTVVSTQLLPHLVVPAGHCNEQLPLAQTSPAAQALLQVPQLAESTLRL